MFKLIILKFFFIILFALFSTSSFSQVVQQIEIKGNERISNETIKMFSNVSIEDNLSDNDINLILKELYKTNFFDDVNITFKNNILSINVKELPIIQNITFNGIKSNKLIKKIKLDSILKKRSSYNDVLLKNEKNRILESLKNEGYYTSNIDILLETLEDNLVNITFDIQLGNKGKIKKISFIGNKIFKDNKLKRIIASEEYKFWKFISGKKFLNKKLVLFDNRLLKNFYMNNGYYNVVINSSFAKLTNKNEFELIFNIDAKNKFFFNDLKLELPSDFESDNFIKINKLFASVKGKPYSINIIDKILDEIDQITTLEQYKFINATVKENLIENKINLSFSIAESEKLYVDRINIYGNNVTHENVIRNQLELDEGDPYNEILFKKSINNLKSLNFFKDVTYKTLNGKDFNTKIVDITVTEKPTGEISASAGLGTSGGSIGFGIKENNFLGKGISLDSSFLVSADSFKGKFQATDPNYKNSDKLVYINAEALETDNYKTFGYKSNKTGISFGTNFEYLDNFRIGMGNSNFYETIKTNSTASTRQQAQEGNYWDSFLNLDFNYDKRNQKFQTSSGFRSFYSLDLPLISETNTLKNYYNYSYYFDLFDKNISSLSLFLKTANSINGKDIKLSERINIPSSKLRGFEAGRVGPKDGDDFIGGNYAYTLNFTSTIPQIFEESQDVDFLFFVDAANIWGVDYDSSLNKGGKIRSSTGIALDWFSAIGPLNFSLAYPLTKKNTDRTETFRFNLGTTF